jgi:hypothetical protein
VSHFPKQLADQESDISPRMAAITGIAAWPIACGRLSRGLHYLTLRPNLALLEE